MGTDWRRFAPENPAEARLGSRLTIRLKPDSTIGLTIRLKADSTFGLPLVASAFRRKKTGQLSEGFDSSLVGAEHRHQQARVHALERILHGVKPAVNTDHRERGAVAAIGER